MSFDEQYKFVIGQSTRYVNILVWNHVEEVKSDTLIGYITVPMTNLVREGIGRKRRIFYLNPPNQSRYFSKYSSPSTYLLCTSIREKM